MGCPSKLSVEKMTVCIIGCFGCIFAVSIFFVPGSTLEPSSIRVTSLGWGGGRASSLFPASSKFPASKLDPPPGVVKQRCGGERAGWVGGVFPSPPQLVIFVSAPADFSSRKILHGHPREVSTQACGFVKGILPLPASLAPRRPLELGRCPKLPAKVAESNAAQGASEPVG